MKKIIAFVKKETILSAAWLLAIISALIVPPSLSYLDYIDFRSLGILWSMMVIMEGLKQNGFFERIGRKLLSLTRGTLSLVLILVFLCYFFSMFITNDVSLLTFVPFTIYLLHSSGNDALMVPVVVLQTLAANLGSMLTPIGNPQNLYLYGLSGMGIPEFIRLMLPYSAVTAVLLLVSAVGTVYFRKGEKQAGQNNRSKAGENHSHEAIDRATAGRNIADENCEGRDRTENAANESGTNYSSSPIHVTLYGILFLFALTVVARIIPYPALVLAVLIVTFIMERPVLVSVDYALLLTFVGFFLFTGNMGKIPAIADTLTSLVNGHEVVLGVFVSQVISNVPAALLLSGFTTDIPALILGVNLGGLGTLIASMASLISFKFVAHAYNEKKGKYFLCFTVLNIVYLILLMILWVILEG